MWELPDIVNMVIIGYVTGAYVIMFIAAFLDDENEFKFFQRDIEDRKVLITIMILWPLAVIITICEYGYKLFTASNLWNLIRKLCYFLSPMFLFDLGIWVKHSLIALACSDKEE